MSIQCQICQKEFNKLITNSHLKTHSITTDQYKSIYGKNSLSSEDYRKERAENSMGTNNPNYQNKWTQEQKKHLSEIKSNSVPWNKGLKTSFTEKQKIAIEQREEKYKNNILTRAKKVVSEEESKKISNSVSEYAKNNPEEIYKRAIKAVQTKKNNNYDFGKVMRNRNHSDTTKEKISISSKKTNEKRKEDAFINRLDKINKANLTLVSAEGVYLKLTCNKCKTVFPITKQYFTDSKYHTEICPNCFPIKLQYRSKAEIEIFDFIKSLCSSAISNNKTILSNRKEIDILLPDKKIAIEFNGLYWHSEKMLLATNKSKTSDFEKMNELNLLGYRYIGIFEDEWEDKKEIVKSRLANIIGVTDTKIFARKCTVTEISVKTASEFCRKNHIQGYGKTSHRYGLWYNNELISVMTFSKNNLSRKSNFWEISRFCNKLNLTVVGGASKLFKEFVRKVDPDKVVSYADRRWSTGNLYKTMGLSLEKNTIPNYWYVPRGAINRLHRFSLRKKHNEAKNKTEKELRVEQGFLIIYDCGSSKWIWEKGI